MKATTANQSTYTVTQLAARLNLSSVLEGAYGLGTMTAGRKQSAKKAGWTQEQLIAMSAAKSFYN